MRSLLELKDAEIEILKDQVEVRDMLIAKLKDVIAIHEAGDKRIQELVKELVK